MTDLTKLDEKLASTMARMREFMRLQQEFVDWRNRTKGGSSPPSISYESASEPPASTASAAPLRVQSIPPGPSSGPLSQDMARDEPVVQERDRVEVATIPAPALLSEVQGIAPELPSAPTIGVNDPGGGSPEASRAGMAEKPLSVHAGSGGNHNEHPLIKQFANLAAWYRGRRLYLMAIEYMAPNHPEVRRLDRAAAELDELRRQAARQISRGETPIQPPSHFRIDPTLPITESRW